MDGYHASTYGDAFADVYDEWYADLTDLDSFVEFFRRHLPPTAHVLELGVGTARLARALCQAGMHVTGIDASTEMLQRVEPISGLTLILGDMVDDLPSGPFDAVLCGFNTFFNLLTEHRQRACLAAVAERLADGGLLIVEAATPLASDESAVTVRSMTASEVVLSVSRSRADHQVVEGHYISLRTNEPVRLRPWSIRWCSPEQLDALAAAAGLRGVARFATWGEQPFSDDDNRHVSLYVRHAAADPS